ncbi:glycosyltransferase [Galactobacillus timonensis]|uniref:glycosyltransferase n=1 Tax=Galactobacillus timonensis TaxID=2041840 RepID=UPI000C81EDC8|nr:glycosyltransferase [Galactobacillus timonensis]
MKTKLVYILTSTNEDIYSEETALSMHSARFHNPNSVICLLVDDKTRETLKGKRGKIWKYVDEVHEIPVSSSFTNTQKSRLLKTSARNEISGSMLYLDSDTIICGDLSPLDKMQMDIGAVLDLHSPVESWNSELVATYNARLAKLGGSISPEVSFYNGGVIYSKDTKLAHEFYQTWQSYYIETMKQGMSTDQPGLYMTNIKYQNVIRELPPVYNCQIIKQVFAFPLIIHYFSTQVSNSSSFAVRIPLLTEELMQRVKDSDEIPMDIQKMIEEPRQLLCEPLVSYYDAFQTSAVIVSKKLYESHDATLRRQFAFLNWLAKWMNRFDNKVLGKK